MFRRLVPILIVALAIIVFWMLKNTPPETASISRPDPVFQVETQRVAFETVQPSITLYGRIETPTYSTLTAAIEANVEAVHYFEGEQIEQGEVLVSLDTAEAALRVAQRQADVQEIDAQIKTEQQQAKRNQALLATQQKLTALSEKAVERTQILQQRQLGSQALIDEASLALEQQQLAIQQLNFDIANQPFRLAALKASGQRAEAILTAAELDLARAQVTAPLTGIVAQLHVAKGDRVRSGDDVISLYDTAQLELRATIPARYLDQLTMRTPLFATTQQPRSATFKLSRLAGQVDSNSGGRDALFKLQSNASAFAPGSFVSAVLKLPAQEAVIAVPYSAIYGLNKVYLLTAGRMQSVQIEPVGETVTEQGEALLLIRSEQIDAGDQLITTQLPNAITGLAVVSTARDE